MLTEQFTASVLVNRGLQAAADLSHTDPGITAAIADGTASALSADVLGSFRTIVLDPQVQLAAPELAGIISGFASTLDLATWAINAKYNEVGGADGVLGRSLGAVVASPSQTGFSRSFQAGAIYWHPGTGAHALQGAIHARWRELGAETGFLGFPSSDVTPGQDVQAKGVFAHFQGGSIYWAPLLQTGGVIAGASVLGTPLGVLLATEPAPVASGATLAPSALHTPALNGAAGPRLRPGVSAAATSSVSAASTSVATSAATSGISGAAINANGRLDMQAAVDLNRPVFQSSAGAFEVHGAIREKYLALGAEASVLGYPRGDESGTPDGYGRFNHFQGGSIYWTAGTGAHEVHALIRDRWSALGWERNPQLGYPISDELIPDPRVGHRRPEVIKKPIASLPAEVTKLPAAAIAAGFPASVVNTPPLQAETNPVRVALPLAKTTETAAPASSLAATTRLRGAGALGQLSAQPVTAAKPNGALPLDALSISGASATDLLSQDPTRSLTLDPAIISVLNGPASTPGQRSVNRFADFESGVLFWFRGATSASVLTPLSATSDGTSLAFSSNDIAALTIARLGRPSLEFGNAQLQSTSFVGTTPYSYDGAQVHNRRHRLQVIVQGSETQITNGPLGIPLPHSVSVTASVELHVEVWFDAAQRRIALALVDWSIAHSSTQSYAVAIEAGLRGRLDPLLWRSHTLMDLPDTNDGAAMAVLSVKTLANGAVVVFVEPRHVSLLAGIGDLANAAVITAIQFAQPN